MFIVDRDLLGRGRKSKKSWTGSLRSRTLYGVSISSSSSNAPGASIRVLSHQYPYIDDPGTQIQRPTSIHLSKDASEPNIGSKTHQQSECRPMPTPALTSNIDEDIILLQKCHELLQHNPAVWQSHTIHLFDPINDLPSANTLSSTVDRSSHLAVATSTLVTFAPKTFPKHLYYKYNSIATAVLRKYISNGDYNSNIILSAIADLSLAATLQSDSASVRTHLTAAKALSDSLGGPVALDQHTVRLLAYSDLHHAAETASTPCLQFVVMPTMTLPSLGLASLNPGISASFKSVKDSIYNSSLGSDTLQAVKCFAECAVAFIYSLTSPAGTLAALKRIPSSIASTLDLTVIEQPCSEASWASLSPETASQFLAQTDMSVILIFWCQLLMCCIAEISTSPVNIRNNILPMRNSTALYHTSTSVKEGIKRWNNKAELARAGTHQSPYGDWLDLFNIVPLMEIEQPVQIAPLMKHVLAARATYVGRDQSRMMKSMFGNWMMLF